MNTEVRIRIDRREPFADGVAFGEVGPYEHLAGHVRFAIDPNNPANRTIVDLDHAPRNAAGLVEYSTDIYILKPLESGAATGGCSTTSITAAPSAPCSSSTMRHIAIPQAQSPMPAMAF